MVNKSISIVIPTFNNVKFIDECLQSIISDCNDVEYEILVGIDGCENTLEYVNENCEKYENVKFYFFKERLGPYIIKNTLSSYTKYENLFFFDSDDILKKNSIDLILLNLEKYKIVRFNFLNFTENINRPTNSYKFSDGVFAIKKDFFMSMGGFEPWICGADTEFEWRTSKNTNSILILPNQLFYRRIHNQSLTNNPETNFSSKIRTDNQQKILDKKDNNSIEPLSITLNFNYNIIMNMYKTSYDVSIAITSYNRIDMLKLLLDDLIGELNYKILITVFDDGSTEKYNLEKYDIKYIKYTTNHGKKKYWKLFDTVLKYQKNINSKYYFFLPDDVRVDKNFISESIRIFKKINNNDKICLNLLMDESRRGKRNWTNFNPIEYDEFYHTQWNDLCFICENEFFRYIPNIPEIDPSRWINNELLSSGVGEQISKRLHKLNKNMYHVKRTLVKHGNHDSKMNYEDRKINKLITL